MPGWKADIDHFDAGQGHFGPRTGSLPHGAGQAPLRTCGQCRRVLQPMRREGNAIGG
jgi:hypothetical protein